MTIRISIADDHPMIIQGIRHILTRYPQIELTGAYFNGDALLAGLERQVPDVLLLDIAMPGQSGDELMPVLRKKYPALKILTMTNFDSALYAGNMLRMGASGYVLKTVDEEVLIQAIESVADGQVFIEEIMKRRIAIAASKVKRAGSSKIALTPREKEVLQLLADGKITSEISRELYLSTGTVENYRKSLLLKFDVKNTVSLVRKALNLELVD